MTTIRLIAIITIAVGTLLLASCMGAPVSDEANQTASSRRNQSNQNTRAYECSHGFTFTARIDDENVWLFLPDQTVRLTQVVSASGTKYSNGPITFWSKGERALLNTGDTIYRNCQNNRARAIWEHAKLNGIDFRAVGNEPGWYLEIRTGDTIRFANNYGQNEYEFATPEPLIDEPARKTTYAARNRENTLTVVIHGKPCIDTMSGESFETIVTVTLDNRIFQGCGRALH